MKLRLHILLIISALFSTLIVSAQQRCFTYQHMLDQVRDNPAFAKKMLESEASFDTYISKRNPPGQNFRTTPLNIPVIVHVVYNTSSEKISRAQVESQIAVLNEDFNAQNSDYNGYDAGYTSVKGDPNINFCLVQVRWVKTKKKSFSTNDAVKFTSNGGDDVVDPTKYLNIWVCNIGQGILGYAQFPNGPASTDGVVIHYRACGRGSSYNLYSAYNLGRTATHEIGHWLGLRHIWGDATCGNDQVGDTPLHNTANYGCPGEGHRSTCTGTPLEMWMNYMDYTDDRCMYLFSDGQAARMDYYLENSARLISIANSQDCTVIPDYDGGGSSGGGGGGKPGGGGPPGGGGGNPHGKLLPGEVLVYPTLNNGAFNLLINAVEDGMAQIRVYNQAGAMVFRQEFGVSAGENTKTMNLGKLSNGVYILQFRQKELRQTQKLVIQQ